MMKFETSYERNQNFNKIIKWFHTVRYRNINLIFEKLSKSNSQPIKILDIGCAYCRLYGELDKNFSIEYKGIEIDPSFVKLAESRWGGNKNFSIAKGDVINIIDRYTNYDIIVALETLEHIKEKDVVKVISKVAKLRPKLFICSVPVEIGPILLLKNIGSFLMRYSRHKEYKWNETIWAALYRLSRLPAHGVGHKGFDWRNLKLLISQEFQIESIKRFPFTFLPTGLSTSVFIVSKPRNI